MQAVEPPLLSVKCSPTQHFLQCGCMLAGLLILSNRQGLSSCQHQHFHLGREGDNIRVLDPPPCQNKTSISHSLSLIRFLFQLPQSCQQKKISYPPLQGLNWISQCVNVPSWGKIYKKIKSHLHPPSGKLLLTFNLFLQEMERYGISKVNRE